MKMHFRDKEQRKELPIIIYSSIGINILSDMPIIGKQITFNVKVFDHINRPNATVA